MADIFAYRHIMEFVSEQERKEGKERVNVEVREVSGEELMREIDRLQAWMKLILIG